MLEVMLKVRDLASWFGVYYAYSHFFVQYVRWRRSVVVMKLDQDASYPEYAENVSQAYVVFVAHSVRQSNRDFKSGPRLKTELKNYNMR